MSNWKSDLANFFSEKEQKNKIDDEKLETTKTEVAKFYLEVVVPAFEELKVELEKYQREVKISSGINYASIIIDYKDNTELEYSVMVRIRPGNAFPYPVKRFKGVGAGKSYKAEGSFRTGSQNYNISQINKDEIIQDFLSTYKDHLQHP